MKPVKVKGKVFWSRHAEPYDDGRYGMDIGQLSETAVQKLQDEAMLDVKHKDLQQYFVTCKSNYPIKVVDTEGKEIDAKIGNGSECIAVISPYSYNYKGKKGISAGVLEVVITKLIEYNPIGGGGSNAELASMEAV